MGNASDAAGLVRARIVAAGFNPDCKATWKWWMALPEVERAWFLKGERKMERDKMPTLTDLGIEQY